MANDKLFVIQKEKKKVNNHFEERLVSKYTGLKLIEEYFYEAWKTNCHLKNPYLHGIDNLSISIWLITSGRIQHMVGDSEPYAKNLNIHTGTVWPPYNQSDILSTNRDHI